MEASGNRSLPTMIRRSKAKERHRFQTAWGLIGLLAATEVEEIDITRP